MLKSKWVDAIVEYIFHAKTITNQEVNAVKKLIQQQPLSQLEYFTLLEMLETHPTIRLDTLEMQEFRDFMIDPI